MHLETTNLVEHQVPYLLLYLYSVSNKLPHLDVVSNHQNATKIVLAIPSSPLQTTTATHEEATNPESKRRLLNNSTLRHQPLYTNSN